MENRPGPRKIAILGGGVGAMSAALRLTEEKDWQSRYDITVYQVGWRLGGKGASGRGPQCRIQEHGLHIWLGFYDNAFRVMQQVYAENEPNLPPLCPIKTWTDAFKQHSFICLTEQIAGKWRVWPVDFPVNSSVPGTPAELPTLWDYIRMLLEWLRGIVLDAEFTKETATGEEAEAHHSWFAHLKGLLHGVEMDTQAIEIASAAGLAELAVTTAKVLDDNPANHRAVEHQALIGILDRLAAWIKTRLEHQVEANDEMRRLFIMADIGTTIVRGLLRDGVMFHPKGLDALGDDLQVWLKHHGGSDLACDNRQSAVTRGLYDLVFAYVNGDVTKSSFAAGPAIRSIFRMCLTYKGAIFWKMQAGMGDIVFAPTYTVLKQRGVKFRFFHRVEEVTPSPDGRSVARIRMTRQVKLADPSAEYQPLAPCNDLPCWPAEPLYDQIAEDDRKALQAQNINLESFWTPWDKGETLELTAGAGFDDVLLAISIGSFPYLCKDLMQASAPFRLMVENTGTVRTQALQLWTKKALPDLGWALQSPVLDAFQEPINTWADMSHLIPRESWTGAEAPLSIAYFCGPMEGGIPAPGDTEAPARETQKVYEESLRFIRQDLSFLWPKAYLADGRFDWDILSDPSGATGEARLESQFVRANIDPSERYVLSLANATEFRLRANETGFDNLYLAGDWTNNGFNAGCVEAAVMSGLQAANAIRGRDLDHDILGLERRLP